MGSTIIRRLSGQNCIVRGLILPDETCMDQTTVTYYRGEVTKPETLVSLFQGIEAYETYVIHTEEVLSISDGQSDDLTRANVDGTQNIVNQCIEHRVRMVYVSSVLAIPEGDGLSVIREVDIYTPESVIGDYSKTKASASQLVINASRNGLDAVIVLPSGIMGPYDAGKNHMVHMVQMILAGRLPAGVKGGFDFVDVRDVAMGCVSAALSGKKGESYILSNNYITIQALGTLIRRMAHKGPRIFLPIWVAKTSVPVFTLLARLKKKRTVFTWYALHTLETNSRFSHDKATAELHYFPRDIKTTLEDTIIWLRTGNDIKE